MSKEGQLPRITPAEAAAKIREGAIAADIRSQAEYRGGHIGGALSLPPEQHRGKLPDNAAPCLIFYCLGGKRTAMAEAVLAELGRGRECYILEGGLQAWKAAGLPVEADRAAAIRYAVERAAANDIILIAGKGHENYQDMQGVKHHFSDFEVAGKALAERI